MRTPPLNRIRTAVLTVLLIPFFGLRADFIVTNTGDSGPGSLRQVLSDANGQPWAIWIEFHIPKSDPGYNADQGVWTIRPLTPLPAVSAAALEFKGESQAAFIGEDTNPFGPEIEIDGSQAGENADGLHVLNCNAVNFYMLTVNRFSRTGIWVENVHGGGYVAGCYIGADPAGMSRAPNTNGIVLENCRYMAVTRYDTIPMLISANLREGLSLVRGSSRNQVYECRIGLNRTGTDTMGNGNGGGLWISDHSDSNFMRDNVISGNRFGVYISNANGNTLYKNIIGGPPASIEGTGLWQGGGNRNDGVVISAYEGEKSEGNFLDDNTIRDNLAWGVRVAGAASRFNRLSGNSIAANAWGAVYLQEGANERIEPPVLTGFDGTFLYGAALPASRIDLFTDDGSQARRFVDYLYSGADGQFQKFLAGESLLANLTATVTDAAGNSSALSVPFSTVSAVRPANGRPSDFTLDPVFPNPFNPSGTVRFSLDRPCRVAVTVVDLSGGTLAVLKDEPADPGVHSLTVDASLWPSGRYWIRMVTSGSPQILVRPFTVVK